MWRTMPLPCRVMSVRRPAMLHDGASSPPHWQVVKTPLDRKSTRLNSSHGYISYAVFCLKKKTHVVAQRVGRETAQRLGKHRPCAGVWRPPRRAAQPAETCSSSATRNEAPHL